MSNPGLKVFAATAAAATASGKATGTKVMYS